MRLKTGPCRCHSGRGCEVYLYSFEEGFHIESLWLSKSCQEWTGQDVHTEESGHPLATEGLCHGGFNLSIPASSASVSLVHSLFCKS